MASDGISLQTTISQSATVAKTQLKGQQVNQSATPLSEPAEQSKDLKVHRVKKSEEADKGRITPDDEKEQRQGRGRHGTAEQQDEPGAAEASGEPTETGGDEACEEIGRHVDTRA